jgi:hypothetical protein
MGDGAGSEADVEVPESLVRFAAITSKIVPLPRRAPFSHAAAFASREALGGSRPEGALARSGPAHDH